MQIDEKRVTRLVEYIRGMLAKEDGAALHTMYRNDLEAVTPVEAFAAFYQVQQAGTAVDDILVILDKVINAFYESLSAYRWCRPKASGFLDELERENQALEGKMDQIKVLLRGHSPLDRSVLAEHLADLKAFAVHYSKKENILFPYLEQVAPHFQGVSIMWALHDRARKSVDDALASAKNSEVAEKQLHRDVAKVFFLLLYLVKKESLILFPVATEHLPEETWEMMDQERWEFGSCWITRPHGAKSGVSKRVEVSGDVFHSTTGKLTAADLLRIFAVLPVDVTLVDAENKVQFYSEGRKRVFPRSPAVIGRDVKNCHPPESVDVVEKILDGFRSGKKDSAEFWIQLHGRFLHIQYFALRDEQRRYCGTLEVTQDGTHLRGLEGEQRLLDWSG